MCGDDWLPVWPSPSRLKWEVGWNSFNGFLRPQFASPIFIIFDVLIFCVRKFFFFTVHSVETVSQKKTTTKNTDAATPLLVQKISFKFHSKFTRRSSIVVWKASLPLGRKLLTFIQCELQKTCIKWWKFKTFAAMKAFTGVHWDQTYKGKVFFIWREPWPSGYGRWLVFKRSWFEPRCHILDGHISHLFVV